MRHARSSVTGCMGSTTQAEGRERCTVGALQLALDVQGQRVEHGGVDLGGRRQRQDGRPLGRPPALLPASLWAPSEHTF